MQSRKAALDELARELQALEGVTLVRDAPLARYTRFALGGPAGLLVDAPDPASFSRALSLAKSSGLPVAAIGGGTNLVAADEGFPGVILRYTASRIVRDGRRILAEAGAPLDELVEFAIAHGLGGLETLARIPGWVGGAIYGNAGACGHSISERVSSVTATSGADRMEIPAAACEFAYRQSVFKHRKDWVILSVCLELEPADREVLRKTADEIRGARDKKFPADMKCAGSIFKNLLVSRLPAGLASSIPPSVIREGKVPAGWFLEQVGARGMQRGGIRVADYHANLIYNAGAGTARDLCQLISELKKRVQDRFGLELEEEIQYLPPSPPEPSSA